VDANVFFMGEVTKWKLKSFFYFRRMGNIRNIIFDFGGVIIDIDYQSTIRSFQNLGIGNFEEHYSKMKQSHLFDDLEKGKITPHEFRERIRSISNRALSDIEIDDAWNSILVDLPKENLDFLERIRSRFRLFLLSNTNEIHERAFNEILRKKFGEDVLGKTFDAVYFSHHLGMRKPDAEIFRHVLDENRLLVTETLFVDDSFQHIEGASKLGLQTFYFDKGKRLDDILALEGLK
jgi:FMN phosphatase YigB (HAD superfamily)